MKVVLSALVAANLLALAWWQGWLSPLVEPPSAREREPYREVRQIRPEAIRVGAVASTARAGAAASTAGSAEVRSEEPVAGESGAGAPRRR